MNILDVISPFDITALLVGGSFFVIRGQINKRNPALVQTFVAVQLEGRDVPELQADVHPLFNIEPPAGFFGRVRYFMFGPKTNGIHAGWYGKMGFGDSAPRVTGVEIGHRVVRADEFRRERELLAYGDEKDIREAMQDNDRRTGIRFLQLFKQAKETGRAEISRRPQSRAFLDAAE